MTALIQLDLALALIQWRLELGLFAIVSWIHNCDERETGTPTFTRWVSNLCLSRVILEKLLFPGLPSLATVQKKSSKTGNGQCQDRCKVGSILGLETGSKSRMIVLGMFIPLQNIHLWKTLFH
jgi:hypothetical protein